MEKINDLKETQKKAQDLDNQYNISVEEFAYMLGDEELYKKYLLRPIYNPLKVIESIHKELRDYTMRGMNWMIMKLNSKSII